MARSRHPWDILRIGHKINHMNPSGAYAVYFRPWLVVVIFHHLVVFTVVSLIAYKVASYPEFTNRKGEDHDDSAPGTEPPSESETTKCQNYQIQLFRDRYRLLADDPRNAPAQEGIYVGDFDSAARVLDGVGISVPPRLFLCVELINFYANFV